MPRSRQTHIFATRSDLIPGLRHIGRAIKYVRCDGIRPGVPYEGLRTNNDFEEYASLEEWTDLGKNTTGSHSGYCLLVIPKNAKVRVERIRHYWRTVGYDLNQLKNPDSITFLPGGIYDDQRILVCGHIGTVSDSPASLSLYKAFVKAVTQGFERISGYRVGPEAARMMDEGYRMVTIGITSPDAYDLRRPT